MWLCLVTHDRYVSCFILVTFIIWSTLCLLVIFYLLFLWTLLLFKTIPSAYCFGYFYLCDWLAMYQPLPDKDFWTLLLPVSARRGTFFILSLIIHAVHLKPQTVLVNSNYYSSIYFYTWKFELLNFALTWSHCTGEQGQQEKDQLA